MLGSMVFSALLVAGSFAPSYMIYAIFLPLIGCVALLTFIGANTMVQLRTDSEIRGRVMGIYLTVFLGGTPIVSPVIGWMTQVIGTRETIGICGSISLLAALITYSQFHDKGAPPASVAVADVLEPTYENKKD
jgi:MFS family permease